ncbi:MAG: putative peptidoglycan glycosyltransferase FtsW [Fusobacteria bacterium]|nr:putative peptidoglycan glycosyltransferase FtsW [Fusobacteriota bacterium]
MEIWRKKIGLLIIMLIFTAYSIIFVYSSSFPTAIRTYHNPYRFILMQVIWYAISYVAFFFVSGIDYKKYITKRNTIYLLGFILLVAVLVVGKRVNGSRRWIGIGPLTFAPAEFAKLCFIVYFSTMLAKFKKMGTKNLAILFPAFIVAVIYIGLIFLEKDFGTIAVLGGTILIMLFFTNIQIKYFVGIVILAIGASIPAIVLSAHRISRVISFFEGVKNNGVGGGYQVQQSIIGIGHGGLFGLGIGNGIQKYYYLPELHTDFIFSVIGEEGGYVLALILIIAFIVFFYIGIKIALDSKDWFAKYFVSGYFVMVILQALMNMMVATGMMPATGRPLPFISYGGTSVFILFLGLGIVFNILKQEEKREAIKS